MKVRTTPASSTVHVVVTGPLIACDAAGAATGFDSSFFFNGRSIFGFPESRRIPSLSSMFLPGTIELTTRKTDFSSVGNFRFSNSSRATGILLTAASRGSPSNGSSFNCSEAIFTISGIWRKWCFSEIPKHRLAVTLINFLPRSEEHVIKRLEPVLLTARRHACP